VAAVQVGVTLPPNDYSYSKAVMRSALLFDALAAAGVPEVKSVWAHEIGGARMFNVVSIKQAYAGHARQALHLAAACQSGSYLGRFVVVVDDDIDPTNFDDVVWAMCTRCDPREGMEILHGGWSSALDPMCYDTQDDRRNSRVIIDACIPFRRKKTFPKVARASKALDDRMRAKFGKDLPKGF